MGEIVEGAGLEASGGTERVSMGNMLPRNSHVANCSILTLLAKSRDGAMRIKLIDLTRRHEASLTNTDRTRR
jgi:hypothetical protein